MNHPFIRKYLAGSDPVSMKTRRYPRISSCILALVMVFGLLPWGSSAGAASALDEQLFKAVKNGNTPEVRALLERGADANSKGNDGTTALMAAAYKGSREIIVILTERGIDANARDDRGRTALIYAAVKGNASIMDALTEKGADINAQDERGLTPLMWASFSGHVQMVRTLLNKGADAKVKSTSGSTAFSLAVKKGHSEIAELLKNGEEMTTRREMILGTMKLFVLVILFIVIARIHEGHSLASPFFECQRWTLNDAYRILAPLLAFDYLQFMIHQMLPQYGSFLTSAFDLIGCILMYGGYFFFIRNAYGTSALTFGLDRVKFSTSGVRNANIALVIALFFIVCDPGVTRSSVHIDAKHPNPLYILHLITFLIVVFAAPVLEELLFRGILYAPVARRVGAWKAMVLVSAVGSLFHLHSTDVQTLWQFVIFFLLCYGYVRSTSLYGPIIWHATLNFVMFRREVATALTGYVSGQTLDRYYFCGLFLLLLIVNSLWLVMILKKANPDQRGTNRCCAKKE